MAAAPIEMDLKTARIRVTRHGPNTPEVDGPRNESIRNRAESDLLCACGGATLPFGEREDETVDTSSFRPKVENLKRSLRGATAADVVLLVEQCLRFGHVEQALAICDAAHGLGIDEAALAVSEALARFGAGDAERAVAGLDEVLASSPGHLVALFQKALFLARRGDVRESEGIL